MKQRRYYQLWRQVLSGIFASLLVSTVAWATPPSADIAPKVVAVVSLYPPFPLNPAPATFVPPATLIGTTYDGETLVVTMQDSAGLFWWAYCIRTIQGGAVCRFTEFSGLFAIVFNYVD